VEPRGAALAVVFSRARGEVSTFTKIKARERKGLLFSPLLAEQRNSTMQKGNDDSPLPEQPSVHSVHSGVYVPGSSSPRLVLGSPHLSPWENHSLLIPPQHLLLLLKSCWCCLPSSGFHIIQTVRLDEHHRPFWP